MSRNSNLLNKVSKFIDKRAKLDGAGKSFRIILDDEETTIRTRGFNEQRNSHDPIQTSEDTTHD